MSKSKNEFKSLNELDILKLEFYEKLKKEVKTFSINSCSDQFLKGIEKGIIAVVEKYAERNNKNK
jgi:hypothetical protein